MKSEGSQNRPIMLIAAGFPRVELSFGDCISISVENHFAPRLSQTMSHSKSALSRRPVSLRTRDSGTFEKPLNIEAFSVPALMASRDTISGFLGPLARLLK